MCRSEKPHQVCQSAQCCEGEGCCEERGTHGHFSVILCMNGRVVRWQIRPDQCAEVATDWSRGAPGGRGV